MKRYENMSKEEIMLLFDNCGSYGALRDAMKFLYEQLTPRIAHVRCPQDLDVEFERFKEICLGVGACKKCHYNKHLDGIPQWRCFCEYLKEEI